MRLYAVTTMVCVGNERWSVFTAVEAQTNCIAQDLAIKSLTDSKLDWNINGASGLCNGVSYQYEECVAVEATDTPRLTKYHVVADVDIDDLEADKNWVNFNTE